MLGNFFNMSQSVTVLLSYIADTRGPSEPKNMPEVFEKEMFKFLGSVPINPNIFRDLKSGL